MTTTIQTTRYQFSHGATPRGTGRWAFDFETIAGRQTQFAPTEMTFAAAKKWATQQARALGAHAVHVAP